ncbi:hypothetical protein GW819_01485 [Candidatus Gracilibacteria bacterium]|nr:hypothetical protein [Candidatus Gracilibacteria bacterium]OIO78169.1 MAG: hypothetical protein AUJ87_00235 [Candidatus Gracilibacteria bacterium CG1_02_38_174]PIQ10517.1 MAG: hypothetical protein COW68_04385 [Candidatus Gracilibacteria bacterium CG18_big_fil_WC_8_21_14_2_50_38_16]PIQ41734.1 MAG: hypothetical protein COW06_02050 [Candidatus Gracilibacteria bacterium CG12_big_fil_rev_8_21_14_0_65_38_15]PIZ01767.1 MAG: hypothetical protein COY60_01885 [Candidatus Gracilibacteria bacterium CG_4
MNTLSQIHSQTQNNSGKVFLGAFGNKETFSHQGNYEMIHIEERLFFLKTQNIIDELTQIMTFIKELENIGLKNTEILEQIHDILTKLRSGDRSYKYTKIVHVLTKYLSGIRNFSSSSSMKSIMFYKRLFESTLVAIIQELDSFEEEIY